MVSRRQILKRATLGVGGIAAAGIGWQFRPILPPDAPPDQPLAAGDGPTLLVAYGSMMGSTGGQAAWIAAAARARGYRVQLSRIETAPAPDSFDAVVLGSAIRASAWLPEVTEWAAAQEAALAGRKLGLFQSSMTCAGMLRGNRGAALTADQRARLRGDCDSLFTAAPSLAGSEVAFFPGRLDFARLSPVLRIGYPVVSGSLMTGDYRDRARVESWAQTITG
ncbi:MAG: flavodoxin domain-containing protein [Tropicimonas sp.]|uniref:flavodoxin domain-containing protein n=1 Tax=Tropicimonas sp. TaxID=2067044 RepID=UPI003A897820